MDSKPLSEEMAVRGGLATRRNVPCPAPLKQENMDVPIRPGSMPNGFPGGMSVCPPRGNPTSNFSTTLSKVLQYGHISPALLLLVKLTVSVKIRTFLTLLVDF